MAGIQERSGSHAPGDASSSGFREAWRGRARWQRAAAIASLLVTLISGGLLVASGGPDPAPADEPPASARVGDGSSSVFGPDGPGNPLIGPGIAGGLWDGPLPPPPEAGGDLEGVDGDADGTVDGGASATAGEGETDELPWSPALFKTGFSFFMGFALAFAVRSFVRISLVAIGLMALMLFGLEYMGLVTVEWGVMADRWDGLLAWLRPQITSFHGFISGQLPSAAAVTGGIVTGWRRG